MRLRERSVHPLLVSRSSGYLLILPFVAFFAVALVVVYLALTRPWPFPTAAAEQTGNGAAGNLMVPAGSPVELRNTVAQTASEWGVDTCLPRVVAMSNFLTSDVQYSAMSLRGPDSNADRETFVAAISGRDQSGLRMLSTLAAAPVPGGCNGFYQTVAAFALGCSQARELYFRNFTEKLELGDFVSVYRNAGDAFVYLIELEGKSCTAIKAEMLY